MISSLLGTRPSRVRVTLTLGIAALLALTLLASRTTEVRAQDVGIQSAAACSSTHGNIGSFTCVFVRGTGLFVNYSNISHLHADEKVNNFCNVFGTVWGTRQSGSSYNKTLRTTGCRIEEGDINVPVNLHMRNGTLFCSQYGHDGALAPGAPCIRIRG